jgi:hypothetical protein
MTDSGASSQVEKAHQNPKPSRGSFFSSKKRFSEKVNPDEESTDVTTEVKSQEDEIIPLSVIQLFRWA